MKNRENVHRGSRKHILDWVESPTFRDELNEMLEPTGAVVGSTDHWMPEGYSSPDECLLDRPAGGFVTEEICEEIGNWWLKHRTSKANTPNWDLVASCTVAGRPGLVLIEAKANRNEIHTSGKLLAKDASDKSKANHDRIAAAIDEARLGFESSGSHLGISRDRSYQLSNRLAFSWKLTSKNIPVVLIYLGFLNDVGISDAGKPLVSHQDWIDYFSETSSDILPVEFREREIRVGDFPIWVLLRSMDVIESSPLASTKA